MFGKKGSLEIELPSTDCTTGQTLTGTVRLDTKKPVSASRLSVSLLVETDDGEDFEGAREWQVYDADVVELRQAHEYPASHHEAFPFSFEVPPPPPPPVPEEGGALTERRNRRAMKQWRKTNTRYSVVAHLEAKGRDLRRIAKLTVDGKKYRNTIVSRG